jgi:hypothetical protein
MGGVAEIGCIEVRRGVEDLQPTHHKHRQRSKRQPVRYAGYNGVAIDDASWSRFRLHPSRRDRRHIHRSTLPWSNDEVRKEAHSVAQSV